MRREVALAKKRIVKLEAQARQRAGETAVEPSILAENKKFSTAQEEGRKNELKSTELATEYNVFIKTFRLA